MHKQGPQARKEESQDSDQWRSSEVELIGFLHMPQQSMPTEDQQEAQLGKLKEMDRVGKQFNA